MTRRMRYKLRRALRPLLFPAAYVAVLGLSLALFVAGMQSCNAASDPLLNKTAQAPAGELR